MAKIIINAEIKGTKIGKVMTLNGQDLYFFKQREQKGRESWVKEFLSENTKIEDIEIVED